MTVETASAPTEEPQPTALRGAVSKWLSCEGEVVPPRGSWPEALQRVHAYGLLAIVAGFFALAFWSSVLAHRFSLTLDYSFYGQAWFLIAHGHLNPYSTTFPPSFWRNAFELVIWPLAPLWYLWPHTETLLWVQDAATAGCEAVLLVWMCEITAIQIAKKQLGNWGVLFPAFGVVLMIASPWTLWIDSFDFHPQAIDLLITLLAARSFWKGRYQRGWAYAAMALLCGAIGATYVAGLGISALIAGRQWRRVGFVLVLLGVGWLLFLSRIGADHASGVYTDLARGSHIHHLSTLTVLKLIVEHPSRAVAAIWKVRADIYADVAGGGVLGLFSPWTFGITSLVLLEGALTGDAGFIQPSVQNSLPAILLVPFGTVALLLHMATARLRLLRVISVILAGLVVLNVLGWARVWSGRVERQWLSVPATSASVLSRSLKEIPSGDEVVASQGVMGSFAFRKWIYPLVAGPAAEFPAQSRTVWFVITPYLGIETEPATAAEAQIEQLVDHLHARMVTDDDGVYVFKLDQRGARKPVTFTSDPSVPAWTLAYTGIVRNPRAPASTWHAESNGPGYVVSGEGWNIASGRFSATARFASNGPIEVQVWDDSTAKMIASTTFPSTSGVVTTESVGGTLINYGHTVAFSGSSIFRVDPVNPRPRDYVEVRVVNPGETRAAVYSVSLAHVRVPK